MFSHLSCRVAAPLAVALLATTGLASPALAQQQAGSAQSRSYAIPAGDLGPALQAFSRQSGLVVDVDPELVRGVPTDGLRGGFAPRQALERLLDGTGFAFTFTGPRTVAIRPLGLAPSAPARSPVPAPAAGEASNAAQPTRLAGMTVTDSAILDEESYSPAPSSIALGIDLPLRQTPFTVNQVTEEIIEERGDVNIFDTLEGFAGVTTTSTNADIGQGISRSINIRGFNISDGAAFLVNGQRAYSLGSQNRDPANLARVELLRGPAALYYGAGEPGGVINYVYKRPLAEARYAVRAETDTHGSYGGSVDLGGPINDDGTLMYRAVGNYQNYDDDQDYVFFESVSALGAITWAPSAAVEATVTYEYYDFESVTEQENNRRLDQVPQNLQDSLGLMPGDYYPVPRDFFFGQPDDRAIRTSHTVIADVTWRPTDDLRVRAFGNYQHADQNFRNTRILGGGRAGGPNRINPDGTVPRFVSFGGRNASPRTVTDNYSLGLEIGGSFDTFGLTHEWLLGGGYGHSEQESTFLPPDVRCLFEQNANDQACAIPGGGNASRDFAPDDLDIFNPVYTPWEGDFLADRAIGGIPADTRDDYNLYIQDVITLPNDTTRVVLGLGWSRFENFSAGRYTDFDTLARGPDSSNDVEAFTPRLAVMQDIGASTTIYASYGESFAPQGSLDIPDVDGDPILTPERGKQYEIGIKRDVLGGAGLIQAAIFRLEKENVTRAANVDTCLPSIIDPGDPQFCYFELDGLQRSDGIEVSAQGQLTPWWSVSLGYAYLDATIVTTNDDTARGRQLPYVPEHSVTLWNRFDLFRFADGGNIGLGAGLNYYSEVNNGFDANGDTDINPDYALVNLGLFYTRQVGGGELKISAQLRNALDATYYDRRRYATSGTIVWGNERRGFLSIGYTF